MDIVKQLETEFKLKAWQVKNTLELIDDGNTIPFIARYRKEATGSLDDQLLRELNDRLAYLRNLEEQKEKVLVLGDQEAVGPFEGRMDAPAHMREMRAASLCWLAERKLDSGVSPVPSDQVTVEYLRRPQAERERLEKEAAHGE